MRRVGGLWANEATAANATSSVAKRNLIFNSWLISPVRITESEAASQIKSRLLENNRRGTVWSLARWLWWCQRAFLSGRPFMPGPSETWWSGAGRHLYLYHRSRKRCPKSGHSVYPKPRQVIVVRPLISFRSLTMDRPDVLRRVIVGAAALTLLLTPPILWLLSDSTASFAQSTSVLNFESPQVHPLALTPDGTRLLAVNSPNGTLSVFQLQTGVAPKLVGEIPVGLEPSSIAVRNNNEVWVANWLSD